MNYNSDPKKFTKEEKNKLYNAKKKKIQKEKRKQSKQQNPEKSSLQQSQQQEQEQVSEQNNDQQVEFVVESEETVLTGIYYEQFKDVFKNFNSNALKQYEAQTDEKTQEQLQKMQDEYEEKKLKRQQEKILKEQNKEKLSRKQKKQQRWLQVAQLKAIVKRPDLVEAWDITAPDPRTLVFLKSLKNTVPVPRHWSQKRKFLQNKRGILKQPFQLPENIENTGIARLRDPFSERDGAQMVKQKLRERMNPKMGKIDIDYEVLHDAFFKYQAKPKLTIHGDIYYEGKEDEFTHKKYKPGKLSDALRAALEIADYSHPPWLINMQRYGPPPSYPNLKIIGLTYHDQGGVSFFNKLQMDEQNKQMQQPGVYGTFKTDDDQMDDNIPIYKGYWGQVIDDEDEENAGANNNQNIQEPDEQDLEDDDNMGDEDVDFEEQIQQYEKMQNSTDNTGINSVISGLETPEVDLRNNNAPLYQVLESIPAKSTGGGILGTSHTYVMPEKKTV